jgi:hypothetical protein
MITNVAIPSIQYRAFVSTALTVSWFSASVHPSAGDTLPRQTLRTSSSCAISIQYNLSALAPSSMASSAGLQSTYAEQIHPYQSTLTLSDFRMSSLPDPKVGVFASEVVIQSQLASTSH